MSEIRFTNALLAEPVRTYGEGRRCSSCGNPLSRYNRYHKCYACMERDYEQEVMAQEEEERRKYEAQRIKANEYYHRVVKARRENG